MRQLTDADIEQMSGGDFSPDLRAVNRAVRAELKLSQLVPDAPAPTPDTITIDWHNKTEEMAWNELVRALDSGARYVRVITGASGILKIKFQQWMRDSIVTPRIIDFHPINNGSFMVHIRRAASQFAG